MLIMGTAEDPTGPVGKLVSAQKTVGLYHLPLAVHPLRLDGVQPRALFGQKAAYDPHSSFAVAPFDLAVVLAEPSSYLAAYVPACVVPDEEQNLLAKSFEHLATPLEELGRYPTHGPTIHEPQPRLVKLRHIESVAADGLRLGVILGDRLLNEAQRLPLLGEATEGGQSHPTPPALVLEAYCPLGGVGRSHLHQSVAPPFFLSYRGSGEVIQRLALCHLTPRRRTKVARIVSPETRLWTIPSSKLTCAAISSVQRLVSLPNSLGERWSISRKASALSSSKAARVRFGREERGSRASRPLSLKSWMAFLTVWEPHPKLAAILGGDSPRELARSIWLRRRTKASLERSPAVRALRSSCENERMKIGISMKMSSRRWSIERGPIAHHRPQYVDPPARQGNESLSVPLAFSPFAIVEGPGLGRTSQAVKGGLV